MVVTMGAEGETACVCDFGETGSNVRAWAWSGAICCGTCWSVVETTKQATPGRVRQTSSKDAVLPRSASSR